MKNVRSISVKGTCILFLCTIWVIQAQDRAQLEISNNSNQQKISAQVILQSYTVSGKVIDQDNLPLGGVNVVLKGTTEGTMTDLDGRFEFPRPLEIDDVLVFSYIGYNPQEYTVVAGESENIDISITFDLSNISLMGAVEVDGVYSSKRNIFQKFVGLFK